MESQTQRTTTEGQAPELLLFDLKTVEERDYWLARLADVHEIALLRADRSRDQFDVEALGEVSLTLGAKSRERLEKLTGGAPFLIFTALMSALKIVLYHYSSNPTVIVGTAARRQPGQNEGSKNALAILDEVSDRPPFREFLLQVRQTLLDAYARQRYPFTRLLADLGLSSGHGSCPLFQIALVHEDLNGELPQVGHGVTLKLEDDGGGLKGRAFFEEGLFAEVTLERLLRHVFTVLGQALDDTGRSLGELSMLTRGERHQLLVAWNDTFTERLERDCVHHLFSRQAERTPEAMALVEPPHHLSYGELDDRTDRLALHLRRLGAGPEVRVALLASPSLDLVIGALSVIKAGGAYVPLDPGYPRDRLAHMVKDSEATMVLAQGLLAELGDRLGARLVRLDAEWREPESESVSLPLRPIVSDPEHLAYVIYTSGSTGMPKGVAVRHRGLINLALWHQHFYGVAPGDRATLLAGPAFDASVWEMWPYLISGASLHPVDAETRGSPLALARFLATESITLSFLPTPLAEATIQELWPRHLELRALLTGGDKLHRGARAGDPWRFVNHYGPTESTVVTTCSVVRDTGNGLAPPIGRPLQNLRTYMLDPRLEPVPIGASGELFVGGVGLARGYLRRPALTAETFLPHPFSLEPGGRLYRTRDLVHLQMDGELRFEGRADHQIKLRGYRIELGEVETVLELHPGVAKSVAVVPEVHEEERIIAYLTPKPGAEVSFGELREFLQQRLPSYMIPAAFVEIETFPLNANGKIDRRALPAPAGEEDFEGGESFLAPRNHKEETLAGIFAEVLGLERVSVTDNFFEIGGHSILATQVISRVREALGVEVPLRIMFEEPTVAELVLHIDPAPEPGKEEKEPEEEPIERISRQGALPLSFAQERLWFLHQLQPQSPAYNMPMAFRIVGPLQLRALALSLSELVRRHEVLRTSFEMLEGLPVQVIASACRVSLPVVDLSALPASQQPTVCQRLAREEALRPFDLHRGPLMLRVRLLQLAPEDAVVLFTMHHIASDGWSLGVLVREVEELYRSFLKGEVATLPPLLVQYADFAAWQRGRLTGEVLEEQLSYWRQQLRGAAGRLELPTDRPRQAELSSRGAHLGFRLSTKLVDRLRNLSQERSVTLFMMLLAAFKCLLYRYTGQTDILVGSPIANRTRFEIEGLIGFFVNTLVIRNEISGDMPFGQFLMKVQETSLGAFSHQDLPFERLVDEMAVERDLSRQPLFQVMFSLHLTEVPELKLPGLRMLPFEVPAETGNFDLELSLRDIEGELEGFLSYLTELFDRTTIKRMARHLEGMLWGLVRDPRKRISELPLLTAAERQQLWAEWNDTRSEYPDEVLLQDLLEAQAERSPEAVAVVFESQHLSYGGLARRAARLADRLRELGVAAETLVGLHAERSLEMVVGLVAILKAGGAYVPLDPSYPEKRLAFMLEDARMPVLLSQDGSAGEGTAGCKILPLASSPPQGSKETRPLPGISAGNLAYMIYTSGSTGQPKGVMNSHRGIVNRLLWMQQAYGLTENDRVLQKTPFSFDVSVWEFFWPLIVGAPLVVAPPGEHRHSAALLRRVARERITTLHFVPSMLRAFVEEQEFPSSRSLQRVICSGEALPFDLEQHFLATSSAALHNLYGPTEAAVDVTYQRCATTDGLRAVPIGRPVANTRIAVVDRALQRVPAGVPGELLISGVQVARGYLDRPAQSAEKFVPDPEIGVAGARQYRTGDLVRYRTGGELEFLGRIDHQVKIRGFRIEVGEIETALAQHSAVREVVVVPQPAAAGSQRLAGYVVTRGEVTGEELQRFLSDRLPEHMVPTAWSFLRALPLTPSGKIDRGALPAVDPSAPKGKIAPAETPAEELLAEIWKELLEISQVGRGDHFFELGGHSLLATQLMSRIRHTFGIELGLRTLFAAPKLSDLAREVERALRAGTSASSLPPLTRVSRTRPLALSFAQERQWFLYQLEPSSPAYNMPFALRLTGELNVPALEGATNEILRRHEVLRTVFATMDGTPVQMVEPYRPRPLPVVDLSSLEERKREAEARCLAARDARRPFDLARGPMLRMTLLALGREDRVMVLNMHHIVSDGWSLRVLRREMAVLYGAWSGETGERAEPSPLRDLPIQYADFAAWQRSWLQGDVLEAQLAYWRQQLDDLPPRLDLPTDRPRSEWMSSRGNVSEAFLPRSLDRRVRDLGRCEGATPFMTLLAAFQALLYRHSGQRDFAVGSPTAGRHYLEIEELIGFFVNTLVLRADFSGDPDLREHLRQVREVILGAHAHQDLPFEKLVAELQPERRLGQTPLFEAMFLFRDATGEHFDGDELAAGPFGEDHRGTSRFVLTMAVGAADDGLHVSLEYASDLFDRTTIRRMLDHFRTLLGDALHHPGWPVSRLALLPEPEQHQLLLENNDDPGPDRLLEAVHLQFERQAARTPEAMALVDGGRLVSYGELNRRSNLLAHGLRQRGVGPEVRVGLYLERSVELLVALLGVLKAGGAYVPLDPTYPAERLRYISQDSGVRLLLVRSSRVRFPYDGELLDLDVAERWWVDGKDENPAPGSGFANPAYVIYTSGSTGRPKGTVITHHSLATHVGTVAETYAITSQDRGLLFASISFDVSAKEIYGCLARGATLVLRDDEMIRSAATFLDLCQAQRLTLLSLPTAYWHEVVDALGEETLPFPPGVRSMTVSGEQVRADRVARWHRHVPGTTRLYNAYGPTEATITVTDCRLAPDEEVSDPVPIGRPISGTRIHLLDRHLRIVPLGIPAELGIAGCSLARGYLEKPGRTAERFLPSPAALLPGERLYRTGDLARRRADGSIVYLTRIDHQIKVRGFRVELGEIEAVLVRHPAVAESLAVVQNIRGEGRIVAYLTPEPRAEVSFEELRKFLHQWLPSYMIPAAFVELEAFPLNANGKIDRRALPTPAEEGDFEGGENILAPRNPVEETLAGIFVEVLRLERVSVSDNFFELGGHSLLAIRIILRIHKAFGFEVPLRIMFEEPTVAGLARHIVQSQQEEQKKPTGPSKRTSRQGARPLSFAQERLWFLHQLQPQSAAYNVPMAFRMVGRLQRRALESSLSELIRRHDVLRTTFEVLDGRPVQVISTAGPLNLPVIDLSALPASQQPTVCQRLAREEALRPFDLHRGPLMLRGSLLQLASEDTAVLFTMHHIASDGWSLGVLVREVETLYQSFLKGEVAALPQLPIQYADFAAWQRGWLTGEVLEEQLSYWRQQLRGASGVLTLPTDRPRQAELSSRGARFGFRLSSKLAAGLRTMSQERSVTLFMTLLAAFKCLLYRYTGQTDILVGSPIANRTRAEIEGLVGFFVNTLVIRSKVSGDLPFRQFLMEVQKTSLGAFSHQDLPFERLVDEMAVKRDLSRQPLFQVMFSLQPTEVPELNLPGLRVLPFEVPVETGNFDLKLSLRDTEGFLTYLTELFDRTTIKRMARHLEGMLWGLVMDPQKRISELPLLTAAEHQQLRAEWNDTLSEYPDEILLQDLLEAQVERSPEAVAVLFEDQHLSYGDLDRRADRLADGLRELEVAAETLVGLHAERSLEMVVGLVGILKAGGAYVPLDPSYPEERLAFMLEDARIPVLLSQDGSADEFAAACKILPLAGSPHPAPKKASPLPRIPAGSLAYMIYTSGSTGQPKGVMNSHRGIVNRLLWMQEAYRLTGNDRVLQKTPFSFDVSVWEFFWPLMVGASLIVAPPGEHRHSTALLRRVVRERITTLHFVPSMLRAFVEEQDFPSCRSIRRVICSGEALPFDLEQRFLATSSAALHNLYGPTEAAVDVSYQRCATAGGWRAVPIGRPVANTRIAVVDRALQRVPTGVPGELLISGVQVARGYLHRPAQSAEKFIPDPEVGVAGARQYKTGDLVRYRPGGELEFLGRIDHQVKIRGLRIEMGEIEAALSQHPAVGEAVAMSRTGKTQGRSVVAYAVPRPGHLEGDGNDLIVSLRSFLRRKLPEYMVPASLILIPALPRTPSGKIDRQALPAPGERRPIGRKYDLVPPRDSLELRLVQIVEDLLPVRPIGLRDNFFDLGGHSLLAVRFLTAIEQKFGQQLPLSVLFEHQTLEEIAGLIRDRRAAVVDSVLVPLHAGGARRPLFLVHGAGGSAFPYLPLAKKIGRDRPVYGLQSVGLLAGQVMDTSIEDMACRYLERIREVEPEGPYLLVGWSMGGVVAYEMAQQLLREGREVALLALLDSQLPRRRKVRDKELVSAFARHLGLAPEAVKRSLGRFWPRSLEQQIARVLDEARRTDLLTPDLRTEDVLRLFELFRTNSQALLHYSPDRYPGKITFFRPEDHDDGSRDPLGAWRDLALQDLDVHQVSGDHFTLLQQPHLSELSTRLEACLRDLEEKSA